MARTLDLAKRLAILQAAKSIFTRDGYAVAKMSVIAAEAGVAQGTLYLYYESKEALASAIGEEFFSRLMTQFSLVISEIEDPDSIVALVDKGLQFAEQDRDILAMARERNQAPHSKKEGRMRFVAQIEEALSGLISRGIIRPYNDVKTLAELVLALMRRLIMSQAIFDDQNPEDLKAGTVKMLQHALFDDVTLTAFEMLKRRQQRR